jgi:hypothetical protein
MIITVLGGDRRLPDALGKHNVIHNNDCDGLLDRLEQRAGIQREHRRYEVLSQHRIDPDLADPWPPKVVLVDGHLTDVQRERLSALTLGSPNVTTAAVVLGPVPGAAWSLWRRVFNRTNDRAGAIGPRSRRNYWSPAS